MSQGSFGCIAGDVRLGRDVKVYAFVNLYGCAIGDETRIGPFVEIQKNAVVGRRCKIGSHSFICEGVTIEDECFIGHGVMFINDRLPRATRADGAVQSEADWAVVPTRVQLDFHREAHGAPFQGSTAGPGFESLARLMRDSYGR